MSKQWDYFDLNIGDSEIVLINELKQNPNNVYCDRNIVEKMWPKTLVEKNQTNQAAGYSRNTLLDLFKEQELTDRNITTYKGHVGFKKNG